MTSQRIILSKILKHTFKIYFLVLCLVSFSNKVFGQILLTSTTTASTQDFNTMGSSATASLPAGFRIGTSFSDWSSGLTATTQSFGSSSAAPSTGGVYNFGNGVNASTTDRSVGLLYSGSYSGKFIILKLTNNTGTTLNNLSISFDYEKYRSGSRQFDWTFFHGAASTSSVANSSGDQTYAADANITTVYNPPASINKTFTITGTNISNGTDYYLVWKFTGLSGSTNGQAIGIDNFSILGTPQSTLPIELLNFNANCLNKKVKLNWSTASEVNNNYFTIERSLNAVNFEPIVNISANGNSNSLKNYTFTDENSDAEISYYRLKQTDFNGTSKTFRIESVSCDAKNTEVIIYPNPNTGKFTVKGIEQGAHITIMDCYGKLIYESVYSSQTETIDLSYLPKGIYSLIVNNNTNQKIAIY